MENKLEVDEFIHSLGNLTDDELQHWGIKGMRWGQRRYQNKDGSLTPAGRKRYTNPDGSLNEKGKKYVAKEKERLEAEKKVISRQKRTNAKFDQLDKMRKENESLKNGKTKTEDEDDASQTPKKKTTSELTDKELQDKVNRLRNEEAYRDLSKRLGSDGAKSELDMKISEMEKQKHYLQLQKDIDSLTPKKVSKGKEFLSSVMNKVIGPAAAEVGKKALTGYLEKTVSKKLGLSDDNSAEKRMEKQNKEYQARQTKANALKAEAVLAKYLKDNFDGSAPKHDASTQSKVDSILKYLDREGKTLDDYFPDVE